MSKRVFTIYRDNVSYALEDLQGYIRDFIKSQIKQDYANGKISIIIEVIEEAD